MVKTLFLLLFLCFSLFGIDRQLVDAQAKILPRLALLDKDIESKLVGEKIVIGIVCGGSICEIAKEVASEMSYSINGSINGKPMKVVAVELANAQKTAMSFAYILNADEASVKKAVHIAKGKNIISFVYDKETLFFGATLSMFIERNSIILLNRSSIKDSGIRFVESFYKIARIVD
jgi:hypothetical protein